MRLTFDTGYEDYADLEHVLPRMEQLKKTSSQLSVETARGMENNHLLDRMEEIDEQMRYYAATRNFKELEPLMRLQNSLLDICKSRNLSNIGYQFLNMAFIRINALLYRDHKQNQMAEDYYDQFDKAAEDCFQQLQANDTNLTTQQFLYVGWGCVDGLKETAEIKDDLLKSQEAASVLRRIYPKLNWLQPYMHHATGIRDQAAELYAMIGGIMFSIGDIQTGDICMRASIRMFQELDIEYGSDFYAARALWNCSLHSFFQFTANGNTSIMASCQRDLESYLRTRDPINRDKSIVIGAEGVLLLQKATISQQSENLPEAMSLAKQSCHNLKTSLQMLEDDYMATEGYYRIIVSKVAIRVYSILISALDTLGIQYFLCEEWNNAEKTFTEVLDYLTNSDKYKMGESAAMLVRAECLQYLSMLSLEHHDPQQTIFYGTQAADLAAESARQTSNPAAWGLSISTCCLLAEIFLNMHEKQQAAHYVNLGLEACENARKINPELPQLEMEATLEKFRKKTKGFLFSLF